MPTRKKFEASKYSPKKKKKSDPRNTHEKKFRTGEIPTRQKFRAHKILKRKNFGPTKARWHETHEFSTLYFIYMVGVVVKHIFTVVLSTIKINKFVHLC